MNQKTEIIKNKTAHLGISTIYICKKFKQDSISIPLINQIIRSSTSVGANYSEALNGSSRKDFTNKIFICKKEAQETLHWIQMLKAYFPESKNELNKLKSDCEEIVKIFQKTINTINLKDKNI